MGIDTFTHAASELSDDEILTAYGPLIQRAVAAFETDPSYLVDMAEHATLIEYKRSLWRARTEAAQQLRNQQAAKPEPEAVRELAGALLKQWGVLAPGKFSKGTRRPRSSAA